MAVLEIVLYPDPVLTTPGKDVAVVDDDVRRLLDDLTETMYAAQGIGLAAQQVGDLRRVCVIDVRDDEGRRTQLLQLVNPRVVAREDAIKWEEGCLSFPELYEWVERAGRVTVEALDRDGNPQTVVGEELLAVCLQHEVDHLDGILFIDRMSRLKRHMALKRYKKLLVARDAESSEGSAA